MSGDQPIRDLRPIAAIDIGSNSIHLTLARVRDGRIELLARLKDPARLAGAIGEDRNLSRESLDKAVATLGRFAELAAIHNAEVRATATAAIRAARNGGDFIRRAADEAGVKVELISGHDEARLTWFGVHHAMPGKGGQKVLCVDVGGGSTELACGGDGRVHITASFPVGSLVASKELLGPDPITHKRVRQARRHIEAVFGKRLAPLRTFGFDQAIATAGTIQRVVRVAQALAGESRRSEVHGIHLTREALDAVVDRLSHASTQAARLCVPGMDPERADTLLAGALIFQVLSRHLDIQSWMVSMSALRTGLIIDTLAKRQARALAAG